MDEPRGHLMEEAKHKNIHFVVQQNSENGDFYGNAITIICNNPSKNKRKAVADVEMVTDAFLF